MGDQEPIFDAGEFQRDHALMRELASGAEGAVSLWKKHTTNELVAVKVPISDNSMVVSALKSEVWCIRKVGQHPHVVQCLGSANNWNKEMPAILYEYCDLGDVNSYQAMFSNVRKFVPELTIWKFLSDMAKGLDYLHNGLKVSYVHGDLKPGNILVCRPPGNAHIMPLMPTFKLADLSHLMPYAKTGAAPYHKYYGTWEYAPPHTEREARLAPPTDIWSIGGSVQNLAWGILPVKSPKAIAREIITAKNCTAASVYKYKRSEEYRKSLKLVWRPLNSTAEEKIAKYDMEQGSGPHSDQINDWYAMCLKEDPKARVSSKTLKKYYIPVAEQQMRVLDAKLQRTLAMNKVRQLEAKVEKRQEQRAPASALPTVKRTGFIRNGTAKKAAAGKRELRQGDVNGRKKALQNAIKR